MISVECVARHWGVTTDTVRARIRSGDLAAVRLGRVYRLQWADVLAAEIGCPHEGSVAEQDKVPLLTKQDLARLVGMSPRTVDRWIHSGLPTRSVFGAIRINLHEAEAWMEQQLGVDLPNGLQS